VKRLERNTTKAYREPERLASPGINTMNDKKEKRVLCRLPMYLIKKMESEKDKTFRSINLIIIDALIQRYK
jgi:hypothetical protein